MWAQDSTQSIVVEARNITVSAGSRVVLPCHNQKIVWRQDLLWDRQRVVHWDLNRNRPDYTVERVLDMFSGGPERVYNAYNKGRVTISKEAFNDGNFSLTIHSTILLNLHVVVMLHFFALTTFVVFLFDFLQKLI